MKNREETLEEVAENYGWRIKRNIFSDAVKSNELAESAKQDFIEGANWQAKQMYSEEEVYNILEQAIKDCYSLELEAHYSGDYRNLKQYFEQFKNK